MYKNHIAAALLVLMTMCVSSPVTFLAVSPSEEDSVINIDVCNSGKAPLAGCGMPAAIQTEVAGLFPIVEAFDKPASSFLCISVAPAIAKPPPR